jgi:hypothetical protein
MDGEVREGEMLTLFNLPFSIVVELVAIAETLDPDVSLGDDCDASDKHRFLGELRRVFIMYKLLSKMDQK